MLSMSVYDTFISVGVRKESEISKYAVAIMPYMNGWKNDGMSGYDIDDFLKNIVPELLLNNFQFDSEYSMFCMYYKLSKKKVTNDDIGRCAGLVRDINNLIKVKYLDTLQNIDTSVNVADYRNPVSLS